MKLFRIFNRSNLRTITLLIAIPIVYLAQQGTVTIKDRNSSRLASVDTNNQLFVTSRAATPLKTTAITATAQTVSSIAAVLDSFGCTNTDSTNWAYVQIFDHASPSVGTTSSKWSVGLPPGSGQIGPFGPLTFVTAITVAATTSPTNSTGVDSGEVNCNWGIK